MTFREVLAQVIEWLHQDKRVSYRALKMQFDLDDEYLEVLKEELIDVQQVAIDQDGRMLVWTGEAATTPESASPASQPAQQVAAQEAQPSPDAERRQLTVMFCDLVGSTPLSEQLDPEDLREVVRAYQQTCAEVVQRFDGHVAQLLGDALLVYFGWPQAHEDDAQRAVWTGLGMLEAMGTLNTRLEQDKGIRLAIRVGIHTGLVVVGEMGGGGHQEQLALGDTPNVASRLQDLAEPDTVAISHATYRLIEGYFTCQTQGTQTLKGVAQPMPVYRVLHETESQTRFEVATARGLTPLVGREDEVTLLLRRWTLSREGQGQVVLISGEGGIGKSRLVEVLREQVASERYPTITFRCSTYYINSALYPVIAHVQRLLQFQRDDAAEDKLDKLERVLRTYILPLEEVVPLFAALLAVPLQDRYPPPNLTPQRQRQKTLDALVAWFLAEATRQPVLVVWEDLHWADPSTLELLSLLIEQVATASILLVLTFRPEFPPPWALAAHVTHQPLNRFTAQQVERMATHVAGGKPLPPEVIQQVVTQTDGVPLFVEELTKTVLESEVLEEREGYYALTAPLPVLAIPATLHDALMARLDRMNTAKMVAQLGATLGRTFTYELLQAVSPLDETALQRALEQLTEAELCTQRGVLPQATYTFKHALIQDAAYQSLLRSTRQQYHQHISQVLEARFPAICATQPELLAHHWTEAGLYEQAIGYWQQAGQRAIERSANLEAIGHLTTGLDVLKTLPDTSARQQSELLLQTTLGQAWIATKGIASPEAERTYQRAHTLIQQVGDKQQRWAVLWGLFRVYLTRPVFPTARALGDELLHLAAGADDATGRVLAHYGMGNVRHFMGAFLRARSHYEQSLASYDMQDRPALVALYGGADPRVSGLGFLAQTLWMLGYPAQALARIREALALAQEMGHAFARAQARFLAIWVHLLRREAAAAHESAAAVVALGQDQVLPLHLALGTYQRGVALALQGHLAEGITQMRQGTVAWQATGAEVGLTWHLSTLAWAYGQAEQVEDGLKVLAEALALVDTREERFVEAELYRLKGTLLLQRVPPEVHQAEACFNQALAIARRQDAKSWELRAATSLARLWQSQDKRQEAYDLLAPVYNWFTEGLDTADLQEAEALLDELG